jgi:hypothetical protein
LSQVASDPGIVGCCVGVESGAAIGCFVGGSVGIVLVSGSSSVARDAVFDASAMVDSFVGGDVEM